jgi:hypothetical protein
MMSVSFTLQFTYQNNNKFAIRKKIREKIKRTIMFGADAGRK